MLRILTRLSTRLMERYLPDPLIFVILLSLLVLCLASLSTSATPLQMIHYFGDGFWQLLAFTLQMAMVLLTGHVMAKSLPVRRLLYRLANLPKTAGGTIILVTLIAMLASWINWGFGLVIGVLLAKEVARQRQDTDYRLLIASAYSGFLIWHGGLAGSIPLTIATSDHNFVKQIGVIPMTRTVFTYENLLLVMVVVLAITALNYFMHPRPQERFIIDRQLLQEPAPEVADNKSALSPAQRLEHSVFLNYLIGIVGLVYVIYYFIEKNSVINALNLNIVNFIFLFVGLILHKTPRSYINAVQEAAAGVGPILIQFPFYAGLMGMMVHSGLAQQITHALLSISTESNFYTLAFMSAGVLNFFIPSGGGQWQVQAPIMIEATQALGLDQAKTAMAVAWGDAWTNMIQPFWALPALAIAGLKAKDIMGFCVLVLLLSGVVIAGMFYCMY
ncbi:short-chain fatty acid transporter [Brackiella oedipodis]|uniref:short-chain fatty acid transporter n=1 Tax=Brackiella oedipodis TaxID=124225 RepID=UPI000A908188|nr:TIGR00366 family protein [Brackiella oedipodis]